MAILADSISGAAGTPAGRRSPTEAGPWVGVPRWADQAEQHGDRQTARRNTSAAQPVWRTERAARPTANGRETNHWDLAHPSGHAGGEAGGLNELRHRGEMLGLLKTHVNLMTQDLNLLFLETLQHRSSRPEQPI
ncbi:MAG: hypothetical protein IPI70_03220 [Nitrospira sp.]|nr:hypothetical protein [Nitrospira sp.]